MDEEKARQNEFVEIQQSLVALRAFVQGLLQSVANIEQQVARMSKCEGCRLDGPQDGCHDKVALANGHRLSSAEFQNLDKERFDVIFDQTEHTLEYREVPQNHSSLVFSGMEGLGPERLKIAAFMMEYPKRHISSHTLPQLIGEPNGIMEPDALSQTICLLRRRLGAPGKQNAYILTEPAWSESCRRGACVYRLNPEWNYLVVKWAPEINGKSP